MKIKRMLKLTLPALLLAATASAYAADAQTGAVKLNNGTTVTWADFAKVINKPSDLGGVAVDSTTLKNKRDKYKQSLTDAASAAAAVTAKESNYTTAQKNATLWQAQIAKNNADIISYQQERSDSLEKRDEYMGYLNQYQDDLKAKNQALEDLKKSSKVEPTWLTKADVKAVAFKAAYDRYLTFLGDNEGVDPLPKYSDESYLYYKHTITSRKYDLTISFDDSYDGDKTWNKVTESEFDDYLLGINLTGRQTFALFIDFGPQSKAALTEADDKGQITSTGTMQMVQDIANGIKTYYGKYLEDDPNVESQKTEYNNQIRALEALISNLNRKEADDSGKKGLIPNLDAKADELKTKINELRSTNQTLTKSLSELTDEKDVEEMDENGQPIIVKKTGLDLCYDEWQKALSDKKTADENVVNNRNELLAEQAKYDEAVAAKVGEAFKPYLDVELTADVTADVKINSYAGHIEGNGHVITASGLDYVFDNFSGSLVKVAVNTAGGQFAKTLSTPTFNRVAYWTGSTGVNYDADGKRSQIGTLGELGFAAREDFGANFAANALVDLNDYSKVYNITVYETPNSNVQRYVHKNSGSDGDFVLVDGTAYSIPANRFAKSETADLKDVANVYYNGQSEKVVITDKEAFYAPVDIYAAKVVYNRTFNGNMNAVCLPFDLSSEDSNHIKALCKYNKETTDKFWFTIVEEPIAAHTPFLLVADGEFSLPELHNLTIKKTPADQVVMYEGNVDDPSKSYGLLKKAKRNEITDNKTQDGDAFPHKVYGLKTDGKTFQAAGKTVVFSAFRTVIYSELATSKDTEAIRAIGILDEKGVEITDELAGISNPAVDGPAFDIATGQGEIIITSDADCGKVAIYSIDGKVAATADVKAGTTTVNVAGGIYIVMGKKVMVK